MEMEVGHHTVADVAALGDDLALLHDIARLYAAAVLLQMKVVAPSLVVMFDSDEIIGPVVAVSVVRDNDRHHFPAASGADLCAHWHSEVVGEAFPVAVTDDPAVALDAEVSLASGPGQAIRGLRCRGILRDVVGAGRHTVTRGETGEQREEQDDSRPHLKIRRPKTEARRKSESRSPKLGSLPLACSEPGFRISGFPRISVSNSHYGPVTPRRVPSPGVPISSMMRVAGFRSSDSGLLVRGDGIAHLPQPARSTRSAFPLRNFPTCGSEYRLNMACRRLV